MSAEPEIAASTLDADDADDVDATHGDVALCYANARRAITLAREYRREGGAGDTRAVACLARVGELRAIVQRLRSVPALRDGPGIARGAVGEPRRAGPGLARAPAGEHDVLPRSGTK